MTETEEAVARVGMSLVDSQTITAYDDGRLRATNRISDLRTILSALAASQAEVERLGRDVDQFVTCMCGQPMSADPYAHGHAPVSVAEHYYNEQYARAQAAEAALAASQAEVERLGRESADLTKALTGLTRQGSEFFVQRGERFVADIPACVQDVRERMQRAQQSAVNFAHDKRAAEARATRAEGLLEEAGEVSNRLLAWANRRCPCYNDSPSPCPLCGARVDAIDENGVCKAAEYTVPGDLLQAARAFLDKMKEQGQ